MAPFTRHANHAPAKRHALFRIWRVILCFKHVYVKHMNCFSSTKLQKKKQVYEMARVGMALGVQSLDSKACSAQTLKIE